MTAEQAWQDYLSDIKAAQETVKRTGTPYEPLEQLAWERLQRVLSELDKPISLEQHELV